MIIEKIHIVNFKGIKDAEFNFDNHFNLIIGDNGTGKTSVLEAISVALGAFLAGIDGVSSVHFSRDEIRRENVLLGEGSNNINYKTPIKVDCDLYLGNKLYRFSRQKKSINSSRSTIEPMDICKKATELSQNIEAVLPIISYQSFFRISNQKKDKWENVFGENFSRIVAYTDCLEEASNTKMLSNWFKRMEQVSWQLDKRIAEYEIVKKAASEFMREMMDCHYIDVFYDKRSEELMYKTKEEVLPIRLLSSGFRTLIGMVLDIAYRMAILNPYLLYDITKVTPGIVLIDEIDMHLHPKWQWKVVNALKNTFPKIQFIATTHSPLVIASCKNEKLISLSNRSVLGNTISLEPTYSITAKGWQINDVLQDVMHTDNRDPETVAKLKRLTQLARKKLVNEITASEQTEYKNIIAEIKQLLPEDDIAIDEAALMSIKDILGE